MTNRSTPAEDDLGALLDEILGFGFDRKRLEDAIIRVILESEATAVREHGSQILDSIWGDRFQLLREVLS